MQKILLILLVFITTAISVSAQELLGPNKPYSYLSTTPGYIMINEITFGSGLGNVSFPSPKSYFGITTIQGYQINGKFIAGTGAGASFYDGGTLFPLFIHLHFSFNSKPLSPFVFGDGGFLFDTESKMALFINPGIGIRYALNHKLGINLSTGYFLKRGKPLDSYISFRFGVIFKPSIPENRGKPESKQ